MPKPLIFNPNPKNLSSPYLHIIPHMYDKIRRTHNFILKTATKNPLPDQQRDKKCYAMRSGMGKEEKQIGASDQKMNGLTDRPINQCVTQQTYPPENEHFQEYFPKIT